MNNSLVWEESEANSCILQYGQSKHNQDIKSCLLFFLVRRYFENYSHKNGVNVRPGDITLCLLFSCLTTSAILCSGPKSSEQHIKRKQMWYPKKTCIPPVTNRRWVAKWRPSLPLPQCLRSRNPAVWTWCFPLPGRSKVPIIPSTSFYLGLFNEYRGV